MKKKHDQKGPLFLSPGLWLWLLLALILLERLILFSQLGADYMSHSDDDAYITAGLYFAKTGVISMWGPYPSAMIMPGMPVVIGVISFLTGEGLALKLVLKVLWILMGTATAYVCYRAVAAFSNKWAGLFAAMHFLIPNMAWMNHVIMTETPYMLFFSLTVYLTLMMGEKREKRYFIFYTLSLMAGLMFRTNIIIMPVFSLVYLLIVKQKVSVRRIAALLLSISLFVIPWTIRNYYHFHAWIPLTYGAGNPTLLGTYQGEGFPSDDELDYDQNVEQVVHERYRSYYKDEKKEWSKNETNEYYIEHFDPEGEVKELKCAQYLSLQADGIKARYRIREWGRRDLTGFLKSYLLIKPRWMLNWSWAWEEAFHVPYSVLHRISQINSVWCVFTVLLALILKKYKKQVIFFGLLYLALVYIHAMAFVTDRYASTLMVLRYMLSGVGAELCYSLLQRLKSRKNAV